MLRFPALVVLLLSFVSPVNASTYYVATNGTGSECSASMPCAYLSAAVGKSSPGDTVLCVSPPRGYDYVIITRSITINCSDAKATIRDAYTTDGNDQVGILINIPVNATNPSDPHRIVRLRGLSIDAASSTSPSTVRLYATGIAIVAAAVVYIEDCVIANAIGRGIYDHRTSGQTRLYVKDTIVNNSGGPGIVAAAQGGSSTVLDNVSLLNNGYGVAAAAGNNVVVTRSTISGNLTAGVHADAGAQINVLNSALSHNTANINAYGTVRLRENDIQFSNVAVQGGAAVSAGGNRFLGNVSNGATPAVASGAPGDVIN